MEYERITSFGELLKAFRKQKHIGQQQVAERLAVHRNTVGAWERGDRLPDTRGMVLELAKCLELDEQETTHLLEASLTGVATRWNVPYRRNPFFTGREELMLRLHTLLCQEKAAALTQSIVLSGLGGIGKTQLAVEYAYRYGQQYASVFWLNAETTESILASYSALATLLNLPEQQEPEQQKVVAAVNRWLATHRDWLLIIDNVEEGERVTPVLPTSPAGYLLFTTRRQTLGTLAYPLEVERMSQEEGIRFLLHRTRRLALEEPLDQCSLAEVKVAGEIVAVMEGLPLALDQAGAYIEETQCSLQDYLQLFQSHRTALLEQRGAGSDHPDSVATTLSLSIAAIAKQHAAAIDLLRVCALLHPDGIPEELFLEGGSHLGPTLAAACADMLSWNKLLAIVSAYSLIKRQPKEKTLSMHRLVQVVLQDGMKIQEQKRWVEHMLRTIDKLFPATVDATTWSQCQRLLPQAQMGSLWVERFAVVSPQAASLLLRASYYLRDIALYEQAKQLSQQVIAIHERMPKQEHLEMARSLNALAEVYREQDNYAEAKPLYQRALSILEQRLGPEHPLVAYPLNNLAIFYREQSNYAEAERLYQRALSIREQHLEPEHPEVATLLYNLAELYREQGRYVEAERLYQRALSIWEQRLGSDHPDVVYSLSGLGELYREQGRYVEAEPLYQRALHTREQHLGPNHPYLAYQLNGLANLYREQGKYAEAESLFERALALREQYLGSQHRDTANVLHDFAAFRRAQGRTEEATAFYQRAFAIREHLLGPDHPLTRETRDSYVALLREMGRKEEADALEAGQSEEVEKQ